MAVQHWSLGAVSTWTAAFGTEINSLASGNSVLSSIQIDNTTALDLYMDISISLGSITPGALGYISMYLAQLNQDGSTYGNGLFTSSASGTPPFQYLRGNIQSQGASAGVVTGFIPRIELPPRKFKLILANVLGVSMASSSNTINYQTYNLSVA